MSRTAVLVGVAAIAASAELVATTMRLGNLTLNLVDQCRGPDHLVIPGSQVPWYLTEEEKKSATPAVSAGTPEIEWRSLGKACRLRPTTIFFHYIIKEDGTVCGAEQLGPLPDDCAPNVEAVLEVLSRQRFKPSTLNGQPIASHGIFSIRVKNR